MDKIVDLAPYLIPPPDGTPPGSIAILMTGDLCLSFPPPSWCTAENFIETSGLLYRHPGDDVDWITFTPMDPHPDGDSEFRFARRQDEAAPWSPVYRCAEGAGWSKIGPQHRCVLEEDERGSLFYVFAHDIFRQPKTTFQACRHLVLGERSVSLTYSVWFDWFDYDDPAAWPVSREEAEAHCARVNRLHAHDSPAPDSARP